MNSISPAGSINLGDTASIASLASARHDATVQSQLESARQRVETGLLHEIEAMVLFALGAGLDVPPEALACRRPAVPDEANPAETRPQPPGTDPLVHLAELHLTLTRLIAPARGATLVLLAEEHRRHPVLNTFGPVPQVRWMLGTAVFSLVLLLGIALSGDVNAENVSKGFLNLQGFTLVKVEIFLVAASAVGATLANLKVLNRFISNCTYDPRFDSSYWSRLVMGLISGVILSQVVFGALVGSDPAASPAGGPMLGFGQPILAILGGFSAELVHDILTHLTTVITNTLGLRRSP